MAGFVLLAVAMRPVGGWLSDRLGPVRVLAGSLAVVVAGAVVQSFTLPLAPMGTIAFLAMAAALGAGSGATFALVALRTAANQVGSVTGVVGAAGQHAPTVTRVDLRESFPEVVRRIGAPGVCLPRRNRALLCPIVCGRTLCEPPAQPNNTRVTCADGNGEMVRP